MSQPDPSPHTVSLWIRDFPELQFDGIELYCRSCKKALSWKRRSHIVKHISSDNHKIAVSGMGSGTTDSERQRNFNLDLVEVMVGCNIPWAKLNNQRFRQFLQKCISGKYGNVKVPSESTLRKSYMSPASSVIKQKAELSKKYIWINVKETTTVSGSMVVNVIVGGLEEKCSTSGHLLTSKVLKTINSSTLADEVHSSLRALWDDKYEENLDKLLLFITDAAPYMDAAGIVLKRTYPNIVHVTCLAHGLHRVAQTIRECYPNVDKLISNVKEVFFKAPNRMRLFHEILPCTPLPPEFVETQGGTWILAASYYYSNFDTVKSVLQQLNPRLSPYDAVAISEAQQAFMDPNLQQNLGYIHGHFSRIPLAISEIKYKPEKTEFTIVDAMNVIFDLRGYLFQLSGNIAEIVKQKLETVLKDNPGFLTMSHIVDLLNGKEVDPTSPGLNMASLQKFKNFKYGPVTSVDDEGNDHSLA